MSLYEPSQLRSSLDAHFLFWKRDRLVHLYPGSLKELERQLAVKRASLPPEPASDDENAVKLVVRMPDSSRRGRRFLKSDKLQVSCSLKVSVCRFSTARELLIICVPGTGIPLCGRYTCLLFLYILKWWVWNSHDTVKVLGSSTSVLVGFDFDTSALEHSVQGRWICFP